LLRPAPIGDILGENQLRLPVGEGEGVRHDLHLDEGAALRPVAPDPRLVEPLVHPCDVLQQRRDVLGRADVFDGHPQELLAGVTVPPDGGVVDRQEGERFQIVDPHRVWIVLKQQPIGFLGSPSGGSAPAQPTRSSRFLGRHSPPLH